MAIRMIRAIKVTPSLLLKFARRKEVRVPCIYCPGICITSCPTFLESGNMMLSPLGYSRYPEIGRRECLKCWRCVSECPLNYELPETFSDGIEVELKLVREGAPMLLSVEGLDEGYASRLAEELNAGLFIATGLLRKYDDGCRIKNLSEIKRRLKGVKVLSLSPEASHSLKVPFILEAAHELPLKLEYEGPVHIPCLLLDKSERILDGLKIIGAKISGVIKDSCLKRSVPDALILCPRASTGKHLYDLLEVKTL